MRNNRVVFFILVMSLFLPAIIFAETILLKTGESVEGKLLEKNDKFVKIDFQGVELTYFINEIDSIDGKQVNAPKEKVVIDILNPGYAKLPDENNNIEIDSGSDVKDILKKVDYYYSMHEYDKAIELCEAALKKTTDKNLIGAINYSLSSNYLERGIDAFNNNNDDSFYKLSIESAKKSLEVYPESWQAWGNIGTVYFNMKDWKQAIYYLKEAEKYIDKNNPSYASIKFTRNLAEEMEKRGQ